MSEMVSCRKCKCEPYIPSFSRDFYVDDIDGPGTGLCERCMMNAVFNKDPVPVPSEGHSETVCKRGKGPETCVFLGFSEGKFIYLKGSGANNTIVENAKSGSMSADAINCEGPPSWQLREPAFRYHPEKS